MGFSTLKEMKIRLAAAILAATSAFSQPTLPAPPQPLTLDPTRPQDVVATVDGRPVTGEEYQFLAVSIDPKTKEAARNDAREILKYVGWLRRMGAEADRRGLTAKNPLKLQIEFARIQLLSNAVTQAREYEEVVTPFEQRGYYQANQSLYSGVKLKLIYFPFSTATEELQAKRKAEEVYKKIQAGADFVAMVKEHSKDKASAEHEGDFGELRMGDQNPQAVKDLAFSLKDGEVSKPARFPNGYFLLKRTGSVADPYEKVKDQIFTEIKQKRAMEWVEQNRKAVKLEMKPESQSKDPQRVAAVLDGQNITAADMDLYLAAMDDKLRKTLRSSPEEMLRGIGFMRRMAKAAEEKKLDATGVVRTQLELMRLQAATNALLQEVQQSMTVSEAEVKQAYTDNLKYVSAAKLKIVFFSAAQDNEAELQAAQQLAAEVREKIQGGADFVEMVKQYSKDPVSRDKEGDYGPLRITDDIPAAAKQAIWVALKPGEVSAPVRLPNGFYLFKLISFEEPGLDKVREDLTNRLRGAKAKDWSNSLRGQVQVSIVAPKPEAAK